MNDSKIFGVDLDNTLTNENNLKTGTYQQATANRIMIDKVNELWSKGHKIIIYTARGYNTCNGDVNLIKQIHEEHTKKWLDENRVCYDELVFGKIHVDYFIDDKNLTFKDFLKF